MLMKEIHTYILLTQDGMRKAEHTPETVSHIPLPLMHETPKLLRRDRPNQQTW
jgi:hypothetical protein